MASFESIEIKKKGSFENNKKSESVMVLVMPTAIAEISEGTSSTLCVLTMIYEGTRRLSAETRSLKFEVDDCFVVVYIKYN